jgi:WD40 repeat protein
MIAFPLASYDVFLSHSNADKPVVRELAERLRAAGLRVWFDEWLIQPGDLISAKIEEGLEHSAVLLLCMSANAFGSDWVSLERHTAIFRDPQNLERRFVPLRLDDAPIKAMLHGISCIDWRPEADLETEWRKLLKACGANGGEGSSPWISPEASQTASPNSASSAPAALPSSVAIHDDGSSEQRPTPQRPRTLELFHPGPVLSVSWCGDRQRVMSGGSDGTVRLWDMKTSSGLGVLKGHKGGVWGVSWSSDGEHVLSGGDDGTVRIWNTKTGLVTDMLKGHKGRVWCVSWGGDGEHVLSGGDDGTVRIWDMKSGRELKVLEGTKGRVNTVGWNTDCGRVVSGESEGTVRIWETKSGRMIGALEGHKGSVNSVCWCSDGNRLVSGGDDGTVRLWETETGREIAVLVGHKGRVLSVCWGGDGKRVVSGGADGTVRIWEAKSGREILLLEGHNNSVNSVSLCGDGHRVVSGGKDGSLRLWDGTTGLQLAELEGHKGRVCSVGWGGDGQNVVSGGSDGTVRLWDGESGLQLAKLEGHKGRVWSVAWSSDLERLVSSGDDGTVRLWERANGRQLAILEGHKGQVRSVEWSFDGQRVVSGGADGTVRLWEAKSGKQLVMFEGHMRPVWSVGWSGDCQRVVSGGGDGTVRLWDARNGREIAVLEGHRGIVWCVGWSPDGQRVVSGGEDGSIRLWDAIKGRELAVLEGHKGWVWSVSWSVDGRRIISGGDDGTVRLWDAANGRELAALDSHKRFVRSVGWWATVSHFWSADVSGRLFLWEPAQLEAQMPPTAEQSFIYTNAKVLVVGDSGAGKTCLTHRLATGRFQPSPSTRGVWCTHLPLSNPDSESALWNHSHLAERTAVAGESQREAWLWDFGGQADQRLIHQLYLDSAALVLLLFDASRDEVLEGLQNWKIALEKTLVSKPPQLLIAARVDTGFRPILRNSLQKFADKEGMLFLETSALEGTGCEDLKRAIQDTINWDLLPLYSSPRLYLEIKREILQLRDRGEVLLTYKELRERLSQQVLTPGFDDAALKTVLGLLDGPGVLKLNFGGYVLLKPEWLSVYGLAVLRRLLQAEPQLGALPLGAISTGDLPFGEGQERLEPTKEQMLLGLLEEELQERKICLRQGGQLIFPSYCGRERPTSPALPPRFMSYKVRGWLDLIHTSLVVSLWETQVFHLQAVWNDGADFRTIATLPGADGHALSVQLRRDNASEGTVTLHTAAEMSLTEQVQFAHLIQGKLREKAEEVQRCRHWLCPSCSTPKGNETVLINRLAREGPKALVSCDNCDCRFPLYDDLERRLADPVLRREAAALDTTAPQLTARRTGKLLLLEVGARLTSANQKWQEINPDEDDGLDVQLEFTDDYGNGTGRYLYLQLKAGRSHLSTRKNGREVFRVKKSRWIKTWTQQPYPVMLVIGRQASTGRLQEWEDGEGDPRERFDTSTAGRLTSPGAAVDHSNWRTFPDVRWMEISSVLRRELADGRSPEQIKQIDFVGENLDSASVLQWRRKILDGETPVG